MSELKIRQEALKLFASKGYEATTIREIAEQVGIRGSSIYSHYKSKDEIFFLVVEDLLEKMTWERIDIDAMKESNSGIDMKSLLFDILKSYYTFFADNRLELLLWQRIRFFPPANLELPYDIFQLLYGRPVRDVYQELFQYGRESKQLRAGSVEMMVVSFFVMISGYTDSLILIPFRLSEEQLKEGFNIFWDGIRYRE
jgi:AcrR family transcriptional regulator